MNVAGAMQIIWHGHSCFEFINSNVSVLIDPHDGKSIGIKPPVSKAGIVLVSHDHFDHNALRVVRGNHKDVVSYIGRVNIEGIDITGYPSFHDDENGALRGKNTIYRFMMDDISICHCGDLGDIPSDDVISEIKGVDMMFIPVGEVNTISLSKLDLFLKMVDPKIVIPMHYRVGGLTIPLKTLDDFIADIPEEMLVYVGNEVDLTMDDIPDFMGFWIFDR